MALQPHTFTSSARTFSAQNQTEFYPPWSKAVAPARESESPLENRSLGMHPNRPIAARQGTEIPAPSPFGAIGDRSASFVKNVKENALPEPCNVPEDAVSTVTDLSDESIVTNPYEDWYDPSNSYKKAPDGDPTATLLARLKANRASDTVDRSSGSTLRSSNSSQDTICFLDHPNLRSDLASSSEPTAGSHTYYRNAWSGCAQTASKLASLKRSLFPSTADLAHCEQGKVQERLAERTVHRVLDNATNTNSDLLQNSMAFRNVPIDTSASRLSIAGDGQGCFDSQDVTACFDQQSRRALPVDSALAYSSTVRGNAGPLSNLKHITQPPVDVGTAPSYRQGNSLNMGRSLGMPLSLQPEYSNIAMNSGFNHRQNSESTVARWLSFAPGATIAGRRLADRSAREDDVHRQVNVESLTLNTAHSSVWNTPMPTDIPDIAAYILPGRSTLSPTASEFSIEQLWRGADVDRLPPSQGAQMNYNIHSNEYAGFAGNASTVVPQTSMIDQPKSLGAANEHINYRQLLEDDADHDWTELINKIIQENDQQASIFLQQKLKIGSLRHKDAIIGSIVDQLYGLMTNRFGNFLVQRCFDHGDPRHIHFVANAMLGRIVQLSTDAFGCHVVQKAFDHVSELHKAAMVHELLERIPETVMHRFSCHVWQKLFELRWTTDPPLIMKHVNRALRGQWERVALGETGSLVVQNIFENCLDEDKRPVIEEVLLHIDRISRGQFGNWCIQHICEHGDLKDRARAINHILRMSFKYSVDQFASKVIEKMLKIGDESFLDQYLGQICQVQTGRPRIPLIDIAGDQYGNYLIQYIMDYTTPRHFELVASHVRRHMVSLRGSKFGSRVAARCCDPERQIRPGLPFRVSTGRYNHGGGFGFNHLDSGNAQYR